MTPNFGCCFIQSLDDALLCYSFYIPFFLTLSICIAGMATFRLSIFLSTAGCQIVYRSHIIGHSCNYCPYYFQWNMHFGEANDANEATPPWIQDLSFDIELVSFREANLKITTSKMGQISMSMDANGISVKFGVTNQWKWTWANHGQSAAAADAGGEGAWTSSAGIHRRWRLECDGFFDKFIETSSCSNMIF